MAISIRELTARDWKAWDNFVTAHPQGSPYHLTAWKNSIEATFGFAPRYLLAEDGGAVHGVLPLFFVRNLLMGKALISSPYALYGGILGDSMETSEALYCAAQQLGRDLGVQHVELRNGYSEQSVGTPNVSQYVGFTHPTETDDARLLEMLPKKTRNLVRKALKLPYEIRMAGSDFRVFENLYSRNMRRLGTPCFPKEHFSNLKANFGEAIDVRELWLEGQPVAASLNIFFRDQMIIHYAASHPAFNDKVPNYYMYFDSILWAGRHGYSTFDFGRCKRGTGVFDFKRHWATTMRQLPYEMVLIERKDVPNFTPTNPKFQLAIQMWKNLPLGLTRMIGPQLIRLFP